jgi:hypothetical protein
MNLLTCDRFSYFMRAAQRYRFIYQLISGQSPVKTDLHLHKFPHLPLSSLQYASHDEASVSQCHGERLFHFRTLHMRCRRHFLRVTRPPQSHPLHNRSNHHIRYHSLMIDRRSSFFLFSSLQKVLILQIYNNDI